MIAGMRGVKVTFTFDYYWTDANGVDCESRVTARYHYEPPQPNPDRPNPGPGGESIEILQAPGIDLSDRDTVKVIEQSALENLPDPYEE